MDDHRRKTRGKTMVKCTLWLFKKTWKNYGKSPFSMGKLTILTGPFSIVYPLVMTNIAMV
jgi:hypothetical protein